LGREATSKQSYLLPKEDLSYRDYPIDAYFSITKKRDDENMS
jgi:hypothetical protein